MRRLLAILAFVLASCGGDDDPGSETSAGGSSAGASSAEAGRPAEGGTASVAGAPSDAGTPGVEAGAPSGGASGTAGTGTAGTGTAGMVGYLPCESEADCKAFGGGKVCCVAGTMHFCTKPSACSGETLP